MEATSDGWMQAIERCCKRMNKGTISKVMGWNSSDGSGGNGRSEKCYKR